jgi:hypothetical protein
LNDFFFGQEFSNALPYNRTPTFISADAFYRIVFSKRLRMVCSALSLIEQVFTKTKSAPSLPVLYPLLDKIEATISLIRKFIAQP